VEKYMTEEQLEQTEAPLPDTETSEDVEEQLEQTEMPLPQAEASEDTEEQLEEMEAPLPEAEASEDVEEQNDLSEQGQGGEPTVETVVEAVLFASDESLTDNRLAKIVESSGKQVRQCIKNLNEKYQANNNAFRIEQIAGGYQMLTLSIYNYWLKKLLRARSDSKLSPAALETLAIIAYKQPVIRADIEVIRGVAAGEVLRTLCYKGLVKIVGRAEILGRPMLYGTTKKFLEVFGLNTLKDLPKIEELKKPPA
jgi:segregation and condensation protein B